MGFWQTGYIEFHEPTGIEPSVAPEARLVFCDRCGKSFASRDERDDHRFQDHPLRNPVMIVQGRELGRQRIRISRTLAPSEVRIEFCDRAWLNDHAVPVSDLPRELADMSQRSEVSRVVLSKDDVETGFELEFLIASVTDLDSVEARFQKIVYGKRLESGVVDEFIGSKSRFDTAIGYCDGICSYLHGILAKERSPSSRLVYSDYERKFNRAAETLKGYDRPLARTIGSLIEFHFNHFEESSHLSPHSRVGAAARQYENWIRPAPAGHTVRPQEKPVIRRLRKDDPDGLLADKDTEKIMHWALWPMSALIAHVRDIESMLENPDLAEYDKAKLHVLLGKLHAQAARSHAKELRGVPLFKTWAGDFIKSLPA